MRRFSGACRFVYNKALALQKARHEQGEKKLSAFELNNLLPQWKAESETKWLCDSPSQTLQQSLKDLDRAYKNFFAKRADFPVSKERNEGLFPLPARHQAGAEMIASSCQKSAGVVTATAGWWKVRLKTSRSVNRAVSGLRLSRQNVKRLFLLPAAI
jgi:transposase